MNLKSIVGYRLEGLEKWSQTKDQLFREQDMSDHNLQSDLETWMSPRVSCFFSWRFQRFSNPKWLWRAAEQIARTQLKEGRAELHRMRALEQLTQHIASVWIRLGPVSGISQTWQDPLIHLEVDGCGLVHQQLEKVSHTGLAAFPLWAWHFECFQPWPFKISLRRAVSVCKLV